MSGSFDHWPTVVGAVALSSVTIAAACVLNWNDDDSDEGELDGAGSKSQDARSGHVHAEEGAGSAKHQVLPDAGKHAPTKAELDAKLVSSFPQIADMLRAKSEPAASPWRGLAPWPASSQPPPILRPCEKRDLDAMFRQQEVTLKRSPSNKKRQGSRKAVRRQRSEQFQEAAGQAESPGDETPENSESHLAIAAELLQLEEQEARAKKKKHKKPRRRSKPASPQAPPSDEAASEPDPQPQPADEQVFHHPAGDDACEALRDEPLPPSPEQAEILERERVGFWRHCPCRRRLQVRSYLSMQ